MYRILILHSISGVNIYLLIHEDEFAVANTFAVQMHNKYTANQIADEICKNFKAYKTNCMSITTK